jgi:hypothetical protein
MRLFVEVYMERLEAARQGQWDQSVFGEILRQGFSLQSLQMAGTDPRAALGPQPWQVRLARAPGLRGPLCAEPLRAVRGAREGGASSVEAASHRIAYRVQLYSIQFNSDSIPFESRRSLRAALARARPAVPPCAPAR